MIELFSFLVVICVTGLPSWLIAVALINSKPTWRRKRILLFASTPLPLSLSALSCFVILRTMFTPAEKCGVDACGMAIGSAVYVLLLAAVMLGTGLIAATIAYRAYGVAEEDIR